MPFAAASGVSFVAARSSIEAEKSRAVMLRVSFVDAGHGCDRRLVVLRPVPQPSSIREIGDVEEETRERKVGRRVSSSALSMDWSMLPSVS